MNDPQAATIETRIPARLGRLPWSRAALRAAVVEGRAKRLRGGEYAAAPPPAEESAPPSVEA